MDGRFIDLWRFIFVLFSCTLATSSFSASVEELQVNDELLLELRLDSEKLGLDILGYQRGEDFLLSLAELTDGLGFPIVVDGEQGVASGWYISKDRVFSLDVGRAEVISDGKKLAIVDGEVAIFQGDVYVETKTLEKWFPLSLSAVVRELYLNVEPTEPLPIQQRINRRARVSGHSSAYQEPQYPLQDNPYQFIGPHITKVRIGSSMVRKDLDSDAAYEASYALLSKGDLGWMTSSLSLAGQSSDSLTGARLKLESNNVDGPMALNHIEVGDVSNDGFRGVLLRGGTARKQQGGRFEDETVTLEGDQLPDWDVELYQNGLLIMTQTTGQDGRYLFEDVPLVFGENRFELKFFGPHGEMESREEYRFLGVGMLKPGQISYGVSAVQNGRTVMGVNDATSEGTRESGLYTANLSLGLSRNLTAGASLRSVEKNGERLNYSNANIALATSLLHGSVGYLDAPDAQNSVHTSLRTKLGNTALNLGYIDYLDDPDLASSPTKWQASVGITSSVFTVPTLFNFSTQEQKESTQRDAVLGITRPLSGLGRFSTSLWYNSVENRSNGHATSTSQTGGQSSIQTTIRPWSFRLGANYRFQPTRELLDYSADSSLRIERDMTLDLSIRENPTTDITSYQGGINWQLNKVRISARVGYDSEERWTGLITLSTALIHKPRTLIPMFDSRASVNSGGVEVRVYEGEDKTPLAGVSVKAVQAYRKAVTDDRGVAYLSSLPANRQIDIELDESTIADSSLRSQIPGISVISRSGSYDVVEFPVVRTTELEGHVVIANGEKPKPVSRALVQLKAADGHTVAQRRTAFDGFFLFEGIEPGIYRISLEDSLTKRILNQPSTVRVRNSSGVIRGLDFTLRVAPGRTIVQ